MTAPFGPRGEVEITRTSTETQVKIPLKFAVYSAALINALTCGLFVFVFLVWWRVDGLRSWSHVLVDWLFVPWLLLLFAPWIWQVYELIAHNYRPKMFNQNWPPPFAQVNVADVGALTWHNANGAIIDHDDSDGDAQVIERQIRVSLDKTNENGRHQTQIVTLPDTPEMVDFAKAITGDAATFSERDAARFGISRDTWKSIRDTFLERQWCVWKHENAPQQGLDLLSAGRAILRAVANGQLV